ncbi:MAG: hypothetical protein DCC75_09640 [Proteobacteria bacterium]|nr:MAG: hypothetical protein DCC75_09640 [Pseudomonadota bacterium]
MATALYARGNEVHVITHAPEKQVIDFEEGVWVHRINPYLFEPRVEDINSKSDSIFLNLPAWQKLWSMAAHQEVRRTHARIPISLVVTPIWEVQGAACMEDPELNTVLTLQTTYALSSSNHPEWQTSVQLNQQLYHPMVQCERNALLAAQHIQAISSGIGRSVEEEYRVKLPGEKVHTFPIGLCDRRDTYKERLPDGKVRVLFVGRFEHRKGIDLLISCIPALCRQFPQVEFYLAGDSTLRGPSGAEYGAEVNKLVAAYGLSSQVKLLGKLSDEALFAEYAACDIFVAPSRFESFGIVYVEAMMFAKPVIASRTCGAVEVVEDGVTGLLADPGSAASLRDKLSRLIGDAALRGRLGSAGRQAYQRKFTADKMAENYERMCDLITQRNSVQAGPLSSKITTVTESANGSQANVVLSRCEPNGDPGRRLHHKEH